jgi:hypothetical protein
MAFLEVYNALTNQLKADSTLLAYMSEDDFFQGFKDSFPQRRYIIVLEPGPELDEEGNQDYGKIKEVEYEIQVYCRMVLRSTRVQYTIVGSSDYKGLLAFTEDVKDAIRRDLTLSYNTVGTSLSIENAAGSFDLTASNRYISVSIDGRSPSGYDSIDCGSSTLAGADIATNIQSSLRSLGVIPNDGYTLATCSFNATNNQFTISSPNYGPRSQVVVTAGASADASSLLGFDSPTEQRGTNITKVRFGNVTVENGAFPVRYRIIPVRVTEEIIIGG